MANTSNMPKTGRGVKTAVEQVLVMQGLVVCGGLGV